MFGAVNNAEKVGRSRLLENGSKQREHRQKNLKDETLSYILAEFF